MIPVCDLKAQVEKIRPEIDAAIARVLDSGWFVLGEEVDRFEKEFADFVEAESAVGVASGTDAIHLALRTVGVSPGDRVLTAPNSAVPTACAIVEAGAIPCFADVDPVDGLLDPSSLARELDRNDVAAVIPVHLFGKCAPMDSILELTRERGIPVVEDVAQAHGATLGDRNAGTMGDLGCFSFYPSKNLGAYGDGGAVTSMDRGHTQKLRHLRNYGQEDRYHHVALGFNSRLDELQAAILRVKLPHLDSWNQRRNEIAGRYRNGLDGLPLRFAPPSETDQAVEHLFVVQVSRRDRLREELANRGVGSQVHFPIPIHRQPAYSNLGYESGSFPVAEALAKQILSLPMFPELTDAQVDCVIDAVQESLEGEDPPMEIGA